MIANGQAHEENGETIIGRTLQGLIGAFIVGETNDKAAVSFTGTSNSKVTETKTWTLPFDNVKPIYTEPADWLFAEQDFRMALTVAAGLLSNLQLSAERGAVTVPLRFSPQRHLAEQHRCLYGYTLVEHTIFASTQTHCKNVGNPMAACLATYRTAPLCLSPILAHSL